MSLRLAHEIHIEQEKQRERWGEANDAKWSPGEWAALISHYATRQVSGDLHAVDLERFRADLVKVGALALSAISALESKA